MYCRLTWQSGEYPHFDTVWPPTPFEKSWLCLWLEFGCCVRVSQGNVPLSLYSSSSYGSNSRVDVLVCTPGRLADHIASTPHFTLQHIRFLVIDEADCLLDKSYFGWLWKVLKAAYNKEPKTEAKNGYVDVFFCVCLLIAQLIMVTILLQP